MSVMVDTFPVPGSVYVYVTVTVLVDGIPAPNGTPMTAEKLPKESGVVMTVLSLNPDPRYLTVMDMFCALMLLNAG